MEDINNNTNGLHGQLAILATDSSQRSELMEGRNELASVQEHTAGPEISTTPTGPPAAVQPGMDLTKDEFNWQVIFDFNQDQINVELVRLSAKLRVILSHFREMRSEANKKLNQSLANNPDSSAQEHSDLKELAFQRTNQLKFLTEYRRTVYLEISQLKNEYHRIYGGANDHVDETLHQTVIDAICDYLKARNNEILGYPVFRAIIKNTHDQTQEPADM